MMVDPLNKLKASVIKENEQTGVYSSPVFLELLKNLDFMRSNPGHRASKLFAQIVLPYVKSDKMG